MTEDNKPVVLGTKRTQRLAGKRGASRPGARATAGPSGGLLEFRGPPTPRNPHRAGYDAATAQMLCAVSERVTGASYG